MISDNNALGLALVMILPLINYLRETSEKAWVRLCLLGAMGLTIVAIIGTYSRGALFALGVAGAAYAIKSRAGIIPLVLGGMVVLALPSLVPSEWFDRMLDHQHATTPTPRSRAGSRPGGPASISPRSGSPAAASPRSISIGWRRPIGRRAAFPSAGPRTASISRSWAITALSGWLLFLMLLAAAWYNTAATLSFTRDKPDLDWASKLARMMQVSIVGFRGRRGGAVDGLL